MFVQKRHVFFPSKEQNRKGQWRQEEQQSLQEVIRNRSSGRQRQEEAAYGVTSLMVMQASL